MTSRIVREIFSDGRVVISDARCKFILRCLCPGVLEVQIQGDDDGQFGTAIVDEVAMVLLREGSLELFVDASEAMLRSINVSGAWKRFFELNRKNLRRVTVLASSKPVALTMGIARHLSHTADLVQIHSDRASYETRKKSTSSPQR